MHSLRFGRPELFPGDFLDSTALFPESELEGRIVEGRVGGVLNYGEWSKQPTVASNPMPKPYTST